MKPRTNDVARPARLVSPFEARPPVRPNWLVI
jgi:hypothetical protein